MPNDGIEFMLFPTAGSAMIGCIVMACIIVPVTWWLLTDKDKPEDMP